VREFLNLRKKFKKTRIPIGEEGEKRAKKDKPTIKPLVSGIFTKVPIRGHEGIRGHEELEYAPAKPSLPVQLTLNSMTNLEQLVV